MGKRERIKNSKRIVVKVGTTTLTHKTGKLNLNRIEKLTRVLSDLSNAGKEIILVSSGAIGVGVSRLNLKRENLTLPEKQASASVGQALLMKIYQKFFEEYNRVASQILLTRDIITNKEYKTNTENTFNTLLEQGVIPVVNENDTISTFEMQFGDNDTLSAVVAIITEADILIMLSDIDGLFTKDPKKNSDAVIIDKVDEISEDIEMLASGSSSEFGTGGMITKITAAKMCSQKGIDTIITNGENPEDIYDIIYGKNIGTLFVGNRK